MDARLAAVLGIADPTTVLDPLRSRRLYFDGQEDPLRLRPLVAGHLTMTSSYTETERRRVLGEGSPGISPSRAGSRPSPSCASSRTPGS
jgi:hypothetical protein